MRLWERKILTSIVLEIQLASVKLKLCKLYFKFIKVSLNFRNNFKMFSFFKTHFPSVKTLCNTKKCNKMKFNKFHKLSFKVHVNFILNEAYMRMYMYEKTQYRIDIHKYVKKTCTI